MNTLKLKIKGMHCEACEKLIKKELSRFNNISNINLNFNNENAEISYNSDLNKKEIINIIESLGYSATENNNQRIIKINFKNYIKDLLNGKDLEKELVYLFLGTLLVTGFLELVTYYSFLQSTQNAFSQYGYYLIFLVLTVSGISTSILHIKTYGTSFSCMSGMMIGMTIGMLSGFLIGAIIGATNGIFIGSLIGLTAGMIIGAWCGNCCGIMGIIEGLMAGLMGGLMGAMTSLMMINDNLKLIFPILVASSGLILGGLDYMIYKETKTRDLYKTKTYDKLNFIIYCSIITIVLTLLMVYGPKSALFK